MPSERLSWDRKDFFKQRKYDRPTPRWRDSSSSSSSHYGSSRDFARWGGGGGGGGSNEFRRPPGHGKQGGWHLFPEESGHCGYVPFRSSERILEDKNRRPSVSRGDGGKYGRNGRDSRGSFGSQRDWKPRSWDLNNGSPNLPGRLHDGSNNQRPVEDMVNYPSSHPLPEFSNAWGQLPSKDQHDNINNDNSSNNKLAGVNGLGTGQRGDRESSLDWKSFKWTRSGSLSSRGSGFSHSSSSKSLGGADFGDGKADLQIKKAAVVQSPSGDATACVTSAQSEDMSSRKKPRLNWGEGLAKYEKKKVDGPDVDVNGDAAVISARNTEPMHSHSSNLADKSPRIMGLSECASPATPSSVACSSPGVMEKIHSKGTNAENDVANSYHSHSVGSQSHNEDFSLNLEVLDSSTIANLGSSLVQLLQYDDSCVVNSSFMSCTVMSKLLVLKGDISKALEVTESEIDSLENELKSLKSKSQHRYCPAASGSVPLGDGGKLGMKQVAASFNNMSRPSLLQVSCCGNGHVDEIPVYNGVMEKVHGGNKDDDVDSPGTATSKFFEPVSMLKEDSLKRDKCSGDIGVVQASSIAPSVNEEDIDRPACGNVSMPVETNDASFPSVASSAEDNLCNSILTANKESASVASEVLGNLLPRDPCYVDFLEVCSVALLQNDALIKERFSLRRRFLKFKERVVTLKFKAFQHLWKEDIRLLSIRKHRAKSQKRYELSLRATHSGYFKNRSSIRSRFSSPVGNLSLVPTAEMLNFTGNLLSVSQVKPYRNALKMPALILDKKERIASRFISSNALVEDPWAVENERAVINPWTSEEREIFIDKLATFGKDFQKIASYLDHKTIADCVEFYYKNHKSVGFEKTKKNKQVKSSTNYLMSSSKNWNRESNAASLHILGEASAIAAGADNSMGSKQMYSGRMYLGGYCNSKKLHCDDMNLDQSSKFDVLENEKETAAADVLAGICGSFSSEAMSSCITTSVDHVEGYREWKSKKVNSVRKRSSTSDFTQNIAEETCSDESCGEMDPADWTDEEKSAFIRAVSIYGKDFTMISRCVRTRSRDQCKVFFSKARKCLGLDSMHIAPGNIGSPESDDANGGESDTDDACALETSSMMCNEKVSKMDEELPSILVYAKNEDSKAAEKKNSNEAGLLDRNGSNAGKPFDSNACQIECKPELASVQDSKSLDGSVHQSDFVEAQEISNESVGSETLKPVEGSNAVGNVDHPDSSNPGSVTDVKAIGEVSVKERGNQLQGKKLFLHESRLNSRTQDSSASMNVSNLPSDMGSSSNYSHSVENLHHVSVEFESVEKPLIVSLQLENKLATATSVGSDHLQQFPGQSVVCNESQQILEGYPLQIPMNREMKRDVSCISLPEVQNRNLLTSEKSASKFVAQDGYLQKCNGTKVQCSGQLTEHGDDHPRSWSDMEKPCRNGNVKLFGKILGNPSSTQKSDSAIHRNGEHEVRCSKPTNKTTLKFTGHQTTDVNGSSILKFDHNNFIGLENVPVKSYGFWDGSKIQTGFSSIPPEYFLAKYPAAFSNYHMSTPKVEQPGLQAAVKCNDRSVNSVSVLPDRETCSGSNGVIDYQMYRSHDSSKLQQLSVEMKQRQDMFSEIQRMNGFDGVSNFQQQGKAAVVGMNVVGRGGILVGGSCTGVSDPVAALKMHYATSEQFSGQNGRGGIMEEFDVGR
ncbi:uncharacterized protein LOC126660008 [Mercurialis annua]|uniref:uncharacterized protein LOC126660008 n=1 Tax=Mercurialis annua TaxID=3986 RepID=UPI0021605254|nr:uncharacterized protein LOC126660008 [Mercurialis annua]